MATVSYNTTTKGKDQILKMGANKTLKSFLSWPSISYALPCILADLSLLLFQRFWAIFSSCAVCSFHSTVFGPAFCSSFTSLKTISYLHTCFNIQTTSEPFEPTQTQQIFKTQTGPPVNFTSPPILQLNFRGGYKQY